MDPGYAHLEIFESRLSEMPFPELWGKILQNSDGQKMALLLYSLSLGAPGFSRSEPIVVTASAGGNMNMDVSTNPLKTCSAIASTPSSPPLSRTNPTIFFPEK
jgi:hypothetical protein